MKFSCNLYEETGEFVSVVHLSYKEDKVGNTIEAHKYCEKYLTTETSRNKNRYWICYRIN